jgi:hypothetical protein
MHNFQDEISDSTYRELHFKDNKTEDRPSTTDLPTRLYESHYTPLFRCHSFKAKYMSPLCRVPQNGLML